ncbi:hypothetical protein [Saccharothrix carnea]|uniref:hypothetical protein n=1 Tax=Saccharothrix carnea TaxID=1280637 RepID=UPI0011B23637|nr:hypothetical protein [Saccharothrix carnea]
MVLTEEQYKQVADLILDHVGDPPNTGTVRDLFGPEALRRAPAGFNGYHRVRCWLDHTLAQPTAELFITVVEMVDQAGELVSVHQTIRGLRDRTIVWRTIRTGDVWMPEGSPFADRDALRKAMADIATGGGPPVATIDGPTGYGKRTMAEYIATCARWHGNYTPLVEQLERHDDPGYVDYLAAQLRIKLGIVPQSANDAEPERRAVTLARNLASAAVYSDTPVWFVANLVRSEQDPGVLTFLDELMLQIRRSRLLAAKLRVTVLGDFGAVRLANLPELEHRHALGEIAEPDVAAWLAAAAPGKDQELYHLTAASIMRSLAEDRPTPRLRLRLLAQKCVDAHRLLLGA